MNLQKQDLRWGNLLMLSKWCNVSHDIQLSIKTSYYTYIIGIEFDKYVAYNYKL